MSPVMLLSSNFAQEQYITLPASQLYSLPGTYMLQVLMMTLCWVLGGWAVDCVPLNVYQPAGIGCESSPAGGAGHRGY